MKPMNNSKNKLNSKISCQKNKLGKHYYIFSFGVTFFLAREMIVLDGDWTETEKKSHSKS